MNNQLDIQTEYLSEFKTQVKQWLSIDEEIQKYDHLFPLKIQQL